MGVIIVGLRIEKFYTSLQSDVNERIKGNICFLHFKTS
jgi:hypothetical protein